jgi:hypothetical protein
VLLKCLAAFDKRFAADEQNLNVRHSGGVLVVGARAPSPQVTHDVTPKPRPIEHKPPVEEIIDAMVEEAVDADPLAVANASDDAMVEANARAAAEARAVQRAPHVMSDLERDLRERAAIAPAHPSPVAAGAKYISLAERRANPALGPAPPAVSHAHDPEEGVGHGRPPGGGTAMKVR